jgi:hypothetical protein
VVVRVSHTRNVSRAGLQAWLLIALLAGCSSGSSSEGSSNDDSAAIPGSVALADLPGQFVHTVCDNIGPCCQAAGVPFDLATCKLNAATTIRQLVSDGTDPNVKYDPVAGGSCIAAYASLIQSCNPKQSAAARTACESIFIGTLPAGAVCSRSDECAKPAVDENASCIGDNSTPGTVCTTYSIAFPHGKVGDRCASTCSVNDDNCPLPTGSNKICFVEDALECDALSFTCQNLPQIGELCSPDGGCVSGAFCDANSNVCTAQRTSGPCEPLAYACAATTYCDSATAECTAKKINGMPCNDPEECSSGFCTTDLGDVVGTCATPSLADADTCAGAFQ